MEAFKQFVKRNAGPLWGVGIALVIGILILTINFWRTLLLCLLAVLGFIVGTLFQKDGKERLQKLLEFILPRS